MRHLASAISLAAGLSIAAAASASAAVLGPVTVSGPTPYAACASQDAGQTGRNFLNGEEEPQLAVNPTNPANMIGQFHQDRWSNGGAHGIGGAFTTDGGATWTETTLPFSSCAPGGVPYLRASDPWVSFGPDGTAYASALSFEFTDNRNAVTATVSKDGGATWTNTQTIVAYPNGQLFTDKNATTADPVHAGVAYTVWDTSISPTDNPDDRIHAAAYVGPAYFSKTTDGGVTWSTPRVIIGPGNRHQTIGNIVVVYPRNDVLYDFTDLVISPNTPFQGTHSNELLAFVKSTDGGDTWSAPQVIAPFNSLGVIDPNTGQRLRVGDGLEEVAIDPANGTLYAVWESSTNYLKNLKKSSASWDDQVLLTVSTDGGTTWTSPSVVHQLSNGMPTFTPTIAVDSSGTVAVTYYDNRSLSSTNTTTLPTDYWVTTSTDGGATFGNEQHIAGPFDTLSAPVARGFFLGDYEGLQSTGSGFEALFVATNCNLDPSDPNAPPSGDPACGPASSNLAPTPNTNPDDVFSATISP